MPPPVRTAARRGWCLFGGRYPPVGGGPAQVRTCDVVSRPTPGGSPAFSGESRRKERRGPCPLDPRFKARSFPLARFGVVGRSGTIVVFSCNHFRALIWGLSFAKMLFSIFFPENAPQIGLSIPEETASLSYQRQRSPKRANESERAIKTRVQGGALVFFPPTFFKESRAPPRSSAGPPGRCAPRPGRAPPTPRVRSTLPPPGTGKPPRPVV